jgi:peptide-methionine (S)-S-oxide reductase
LKIGMELYLANGMQCRITDIGDEKFTIDANPPLAGASYTAKITLNEIEKGPSEAKFLYNPDKVDDGSDYEVMTIALGCFWGGELEYMRVPGVVGTAVGYTQGEKLDPTYNEVCSGTTGHTEGIQVIYDPEIVSYKELVTIGLERLGDSRTLVNQVGNDRGTQYRHGVYYHNDMQKEIAESVIGSYGDLCVTECKEAVKFYTAEDHHQQYLLKGGQSAKKNAKETIRCYG